MKTFRYWAKASERVQKADRTWNLECYGGSNKNLEEALERAADRARAAAAAIALGQDPQQYAYSDRPVREEIVREIEHNGETVAVLTRNAYGSLILNSPRVLFADIDYPPQGGFHLPGFLLSMIGAVAKLFGQESRATQHAGQSPDEKIVDRVRRLVDETAGLGVRLYRTTHGFRGLVTTGTWDPLAPETLRLLTDFGSDPLYVTLCKAQECFRARVSPKPWRCRAPKPPSRFPWPDSGVEQEYREWEKTYEKIAAGYSTCAFIDAFGSSDIAPEVEPVLRLHDELACAGDGPIA